MSYNLKLDSSDFKKLLAATYGLHDADVSSITFDSAARKLRIEISFIHWGTDEGLILKRFEKSLNRKDSIDA